jgi:hypothetical protein
MANLTAKKIGLIAMAVVAAAAVAGLLSVITHQAIGLSGPAVREGALNVASLVVAFLLIAGIGRRQKGKR